MKKGKLLKLAFKHEGERRGKIIGPVWKVYEQEDETVINPFTDKPITEMWENFQDGGEKSGGGFYAAWFYLEDARKFAKELGVPLDY